MRAKLKKGIEMVRGGALLAALSSTSCSSLALFFHTLAFAFPSSFCYLMDMKFVAISAPSTDQRMHRK
jgi:hypothetical protein